MKEPQSLSNKNLKTRRGFLGGVIAASVAPRFISSRVLGGETAPSRTIRLGHIGTGGQGTGSCRISSG